MINACIYSLHVSYTFVPIQYSGKQKQSKMNILKTSQQHDAEIRPYKSFFALNYYWIRSSNSKKNQYYHTYFQKVGIMSLNLCRSYNKIHICFCFFNTRCYSFCRKPVLRSGTLYWFGPGWKAGSYKYVVISSQLVIFQNLLEAKG